MVKTQYSAKKDVDQMMLRMRYFKPIDYCECEMLRKLYRCRISGRIKCSRCGRLFRKGE
jgi:hypothetical protein